MNSGDYDRAIPVLERAVAAFPEGSTDITLAYALYNLGRSLRLAGRPGEAIPILERRLEFKNQRGVVKKELKAARKSRRLRGCAPADPARTISGRSGCRSRRASSSRARS